MEREQLWIDFYRPTGHLIGHGVGQADDAEFVGRLQHEPIGIPQNADQPKPGASLIVVTLAPGPVRGGGAGCVPGLVGRRDAHLGKARLDAVVDRIQMQIAGDEDNIQNVIGENEILQGIPLRLIGTPGVILLCGCVGDHGGENDLPFCRGGEKPALEPLELTVRPKIVPIEHTLIRVVRVGLNVALAAAVENKKSA